MCSPTQQPCGILNVKQNIYDHAHGFERSLKSYLLALKYFIFNR